MQAFRSIIVVVVVGLLMATAAEGAVQTRTVEYRHGDVTLEGYFAWDDAVQGRRPAVLVVHEWYGVNDYVRGRARQLAQMGYVAFALDMYGKGVRADNPKDAARLAGVYKGDRKLMRDRAKAGLDTLKKQDNVDIQRVAAIGYCFGGQVCLELARANADVAGVVSFHGALDTPDPEATRSVKPKVLACHGAIDPFVPDAHVAAFRDEMEAAGADYQIDVYGGAVHSFTNPDADKAGLKGVAYNANADRRSWEAMKDFFGEIFGRGAVPARTTR
jgi:dienelactone hydrolase